MAVVEFEPWEPEESVGKLWHALVHTLDAPGQFEEAAATLDETRGRLGVLFRGLGGARDVEIKVATPETSAHRLSWRRALGQSAERIALPSFDGETLRLPERISLFPERDANVALYVWLAACAVFARAPVRESDPLKADIRTLQAALRMTRDTLAECPGLRRMYGALALETRARRPDRQLPFAEAAIEATVLHLLGAPAPELDFAVAISAAVRSQADDLSAFTAPRGYQPLLPVPLWPDLRPFALRTKSVQEDAPHGEAEAQPNAEPGTFKASRKPSDQAARKDSLILHKFEAILSWAELLNINRRVDDDDEDTARKAADDQDEISLAQVPQRAKTRLKLHLDLSPEEAEFERLAGVHVYPEWDHRTKTYLPDYCRVLAGAAKASLLLDTSETPDSARARRRIRSVRRQFETLRPKRVQLTRQVEGHDIDIAAAIEARVDLATTGEHSDRVYLATRSQERDLAVSILLDASRSTETYVAGRQVIDIAREALVALAWGLDACGDDTAIAAFSSRRRERVFVETCKAFGEPMGATVEARIAGLRPGHYTRLGTAIRHASNTLAERPRQRRLLLVLTDGKPNDIDHYEGRYGIEDTHMAVREARRQGQSVFGVTIDTKSQATFSRIFGKGGYVVIPDPEKLVAALPHLYRHLVSG
ncbi:VWA domain-containing protein [Hyphomicrobium sp. LHD-15]|uniref:nitric oxide reductase activation protein NorD n=1 Tax=Hyphomicrobium sp. LHD-15 TaxID=3072142 RepID=UPI00280CD369|nr:VWA domain-containing protein [Hyphomicrobium sp. LHD-15]MDQ8700062.1 VWA domain-containing protein [Hyphomicrobium sp. LHD-15]